MIALDSNVLIRYIVQDNKTQARQAAIVIEALTPDSPAFISCIVLCEVHWVLKTTYKIPKQDRLHALQNVLSIAVFEIENLEVCLRALKLYKTGQADFSDYLILQIVQQQGYETVITFDKKAQKCLGFQKPS